MSIYGRCWGRQQALRYLTGAFHPPVSPTAPHARSGGGRHPGRQCPWAMAHAMPARHRRRVASQSVRAEKNHVAPVSGCARALSLSQRYEELRTKDDERHDDGKLLLGFTWMAPSTQEPSSLLPQQLIIIIIMSPPHCCIHACSRQQHCTPSSLDAASLQ